MIAHARILWKDVPQELRMNQELLETCRGADNEGPRWVVRHMVRILAADRQAPRTCRYAVLFGNHHRYMPCSFRPAAGELACFRHGGIKKAEGILRAQIESDRLQRERAEEHAQWSARGLALAQDLQRRIIDRLHERATS